MSSEDSRKVKVFKEAFGEGNVRSPRPLVARPGWQVYMKRGRVFLQKAEVRDILATDEPVGG